MVGESSHTSDHAERKAKGAPPSHLVPLGFSPGGCRALLQVAQGAPEGLQHALFAEVHAALHIGVGGADDLGHHFTVSRHRGPAEGDFFVGSGGGGGVGLHMIRKIENFEAI